MPSVGTYSRSDRLLNCRIGSANRWEFWPLEKSDVSTGKIRYGYAAVQERDVSPKLSLLGLLAVVYVPTIKFRAYESWFTSLDT